LRPVVGRATFWSGNLVLPRQGGGWRSGRRAPCGRLNRHADPKYVQGKARVLISIAIQSCHSRLSQKLTLGYHESIYFDKAEKSLVNSGLWPRGC